MRFAEAGVEKLLDGEDVAEFPDQKSIYTYLTTCLSLLSVSHYINFYSFCSVLGKFDGFTAGHARTSSLQQPISGGLPGSRLSRPGLSQSDGPTLLLFARLDTRFPPFSP